MTFRVRILNGMIVREEFYKEMEDSWNFVLAISTNYFIVDDNWLVMLQVQPQGVDVVLSERPRVDKLPYPGWHLKNELNMPDWAKHIPVIEVIL